MSGFPTDLLVYGAVALMILLFNFLGRKAAGKPAPPAQDPGEDPGIVRARAMMAAAGSSWMT